MSKVVPLRKQDVESKFAYATHRHQELMNELFKAKNTSSDPEFLVHTVADIISTVRECFDYVGQDIIECHILPQTQNQRILSDSASGRLKAYFPFYENQINRANSVFKELATIEPDLYRGLLDFTTSIANKADIPNSSLSYQLLVDVKDMVNEKKHDKLIAVVSGMDQEYLIQNDNMKIILPINGQTGYSSFSVQPGTQVSKVTEYRFEYNEEEVGKFCIFAIKAAEHVIYNIYNAYFA